MSELDENPEVVIIGAGPGGYTAAIRLGQIGLEPVVIDGENVGGVCLNWGCIPTKTVYSTTEPLSKLSSWRRRGVDFSDPEISLEKITAHQKKVVDRLTGGVAKLIAGNGGKMVAGNAEILPGPKVKVTEEDGEEVTLTPDNLIIASGSSPIELPGFPFEDDDIWDSRDAVFPTEAPEKLVILGAGVIGLEMGTVYSRLGSEVTIVEMKDSILPTSNLDSRISSYLKRALQKQGIKVATGTRAAEYRKKDGRGSVLGENDGEEVSFKADNVLVAVGRKPRTDFIDGTLDLDIDERGFIRTEKNCKTNIDGVYAIGDVTGEPLLAHKASHEALIAAAAIAGEDHEPFKVVPAAVFTDPEYADVGLSAEEAEAEGFEPIIGRFPLRASGKALAMDETEGAVVLVADKSSDKLLGGSILGPNASDMIAEIGLAIESGLTISEVANAVHPHPTLSEAIMEAAENAHGRAIHTGNR
ncbi:dihydrolipoyl dehydrogenase [Candidatus Bipolaricaulota bacterium]|nr:dihydrolipoyl dehydrogenase [Candidatus Bipolaricaulota bacterium]